MTGDAMELIVVCPDVALAVCGCLVNVIVARVFRSHLNRYRSAILGRFSRVIGFLVRLADPFGTLSLVDETWFALAPVVGLFAAPWFLSVVALARIYDVRCVGFVATILSCAIILLTTYISFRKASLSELG